MSQSMPPDSRRPFTTMASDSCSVSKIFTRFSLGSGRRCDSRVVLEESPITSPRVRTVVDGPALEQDFTPFTMVVAVACKSDAGLRLRGCGDLPPKSPPGQHLRAVCFLVRLRDNVGDWGAQRSPVG